MPATPSAVVPFLGWSVNGTYTAMRGVRFRWAPLYNHFTFVDE